jgi:two-component system CheB/CheR fusion protein
MLIGVTSFFRDPEAWRQLAEEALPALLAAHSEGGTLRAWVAGCSTGEEAYSLAITFREVLERLRPAKPFALQVFATDLDRDAIEKARQGFFPSRAMAGLSDQRRAGWFTQEENGFRLSKEIREMLVFAVQDVLQDPPFIRLDLLLCRNLLIYLSAECQKRLLPLFHYSLNPGGCLFLGSAESIGTFSDLFSAYPGKGRLFRHKAAERMLGITLFPNKTPALRESLPQEPAMTKTTANLQALADQVLLQRFAPAAVLTSEEGDILYISGRTGKYLEPAMGKANWNIFAMAREGLRTELGSAFRKAVGRKEPVTIKGIRVGAGEGTPTLDLTVQVLDAPEAMRDMVMVVFSDQPALPHGKPAKPRKGTPANQARVAELEVELQSTQEELQGLREEMQTSQEERKAASEELQSTNEELQSTNEELTTSKEELQSLNEELQTVNAEQQARVEELSAMNNDMRNLLDATDIATLFLDQRLHVRRFTKGATRLFKLIPGDVGRPITDIASTLDYPGLEADATDVLSTLMFSEKDVSTRKGDAWFSARILPYRTLKNTIEGVVVTFTEITRAKSLEAELRKGATGDPPVLNMH